MGSNTSHLQCNVPSKPWPPVSSQHGHAIPPASAVEGIHHIQVSQLRSGRVVSGTTYILWHHS
jgi:hypothetical protein